MIFAMVAVYRYSTKVITLEPVRIDVVEVADVVAISDSLVPPIVYKRIPDLKKLSIDERKKAFIDSVAVCAVGSGSNEYGSRSNQ